MNAKTRGWLEDNATLVLAAPDLLAALKAAQVHLDYIGYGDSWEQECCDGLEEQIQAAIDKAEDKLEEMSL